jgi:hypothetical protein
MRVRTMLLSLAAAGAAVAATLGPVTPASASTTLDQAIINMATNTCLSSVSGPVSTQACGNIYDAPEQRVFNENLTYHGQPTSDIQFVNVYTGDCLDY